MLLPACADTASAAGSGSAHAMAYGICHMCVPGRHDVFGNDMRHPLLATNYLLLAGMYGHLLSIPVTSLRNEWSQ